jgi:hypothetical protein
MINVTVEWSGKQGMEKLIKYIEDDSILFEAQAAMLDVADATVDNMRTTIKENKKRPSKGDNLERNIDKEIINSTGGVEIGIGNIKQLKQEAPYFEVLNTGGYVPNYGRKVPVGSFAPGEPKPSSEHSREGHWQVGQGSYTFAAKKAIEGIFYIEKAITFLDRKLNETIVSLGGKFIEGLGR